MLSRFAIAVMSVTLLATSLSANAAPLLPSDLQAQAPSATHKVWCHHGYCDGGGGGGAAVGGLIGGLIGGAIVAGAANAAAQQEAAAAAQQHDAYCAQRYRSYDPGTGTFQGKDGRRYPCR